jgi:hypothetical protein
MTPTQKLERIKKAQLAQDERSYARPKPSLPTLKFMSRPELPPLPQYSARKGVPRVRSRGDRDPG